MEKFLVLLFALAATACNHSQTQVIHEDRCKAETGGFVPGHGITSCDLFDKDGRLIEKLSIDAPEKLHCHPQASYVKCLYVDNEPKYPRDTVLPMCSFISDKPECRHIGKQHLTKRIPLISMSNVCDELNGR